MTKYNDKTKDALRPGSGKAHCRGLSRKDYATAIRMIRSGLVTEQELLDAGKILPAGPRGAQGDGAYQWFMEAKKDKNVKNKNGLTFTLNEDANEIVKDAFYKLPEGDSNGK